MKKAITLLIASLLLLPAVMADGPVDVNLSDLSAKPEDFDGKQIKVTTPVVFIGYLRLAVEAVDLESDDKPYTGEPVLLTRLSSSDAEKLTEAKHDGETVYHGVAVITGKFKTGKFARKKYSMKIEVDKFEVSSGSSSDVAEDSDGKAAGFKLLKKNRRDEENMDSEQSILKKSRGGHKDRFHVPNFPDYSDGSGVADDTQIIAITNGKESKAYPIGIMGCHELANVKLGKIPIAITW